MLKETGRKLNRLTIKHILLIITFTVALIWVIINARAVANAIFMIINLCRPFMYGIVIAFIFNLPLKFFLRKLPGSLGRFKKVIAAILSMIIILLIIAFIFWIVVPQVIESIQNLIKTLPHYIAEVTKLLDTAVKNKQIPDAIIQQINEFSNDITKIAGNIIKTGIPQIISFAGGFASSLANLFLSLVIAVYLTVSKNKLIAQTKRCLYAFCSPKHYHWLIKVGSLTNKTFSSFIAGQLTDALIIGILCYIGCMIIGFPYAPILAVIIGCTNVIPIFGAIIGVGVCAMLVALVNPVQGLFFIVFGICLQQFESNLIYPRVVGNSVGLSGLWVIFAITIGGGLFGLVGMILGLPTFSVIYSLLREEVARRVKRKKAMEQIARKAMLAKQSPALALNVQGEDDHIGNDT